MKKVLCYRGGGGGKRKKKRGTEKAVLVSTKSMNYTLHCEGEKKATKFVEILASQSMLDCCQYICFFNGT